MRRVLDGNPEAQVKAHRLWWQRFYRRSLDGAQQGCLVQGLVGAVLVV